jgi:hypothetical protein
LLYDMGKLAREQRATGGCSGSVAAAAEDDMLPDGVSERIHRRGRRIGALVAMHADSAEIPAKALLHLRPHGAVERFSMGAQYVAHDAGDRRRSVAAFCASRAGGGMTAGAASAVQLQADAARPGRP